MKAFIAPIFVALSLTAIPLLALAQDDTSNQPIREASLEFDHSNYLLTLGLMAMKPEKERSPQKTIVQRQPDYSFYRIEPILDWDSDSIQHVVTESLRAPARTIEEKYARDRDDRNWAHREDSRFDKLSQFAEPADDMFYPLYVYVNRTFGYVD
jgi:hypothetical protein